MCVLLIFFLYFEQFLDFRFTRRPYCLFIIVCYRSAVGASIRQFLSREAVAAGIAKVVVQVIFTPISNKNFIKTMLNVGKTHDTVRVVNDQIGTPTYTYDLARLLVDMNETEKYGYYHATNEGGYISWYDFTKEIYRQAGYKTEVLPVTTAEYGLSKAARPFNSRLDKSKLVEAGFTPLPTWQDALSRYLKEIEQ